MEATEGPDNTRRPSAPLSTSSSATRAVDYFEPIRPGDGGRNASSPGTIHRLDSLAMVDEQDQRELQRLAADMGRIRTAPAPTRANDAEKTRPASYILPSDASMDPSSKTFDLRKYLEHVVGLVRREGITPAQAGVSFRDLTVSGKCDALQLQRTIADWIAAPIRLGEFLSFHKKDHRTILNKMDGIVNSGELLIVLGRPGAGCSTLLKTMTGQLHGLKIDKQSVITYNGISQEQMMKEFRGEAIYNQEMDKHFPHLTVGQTLEFAAACRTPANLIQGITRQQHIEHITRVVMALCGLTHTYNTKVGDEQTPGVTADERKRVSIAEMMLAGAPVAAWDHSTRGLESDMALKFVQSLRVAADLGGSTHLVSAYQPTQAIYDLFNKAVVLYEGRQIYFGPAALARSYFEKMGWECDPRQTTGDFLTSVTNPAERKARLGMEDKVPRTPEDFEAHWRRSEEYKALNDEIDANRSRFPTGQAIEELRGSKTDRQARHVRPKSPFTISLGMQIRLTTIRAFQRVHGNMPVEITKASVHIILGLLFGSLFYDNPNTTDGFFGKGSVLFGAMAATVLGSLGEISAQYAHRPIVEKHSSYAFYHPAAEAVASIISEIPSRFIQNTVGNIPVYFMANLHRTAGQFFLFLLITFVNTFIMMGLFRTLAGATRTAAIANALAGPVLLALILYTNFVMRVPEMHPWFSWLRWINPVYYSFEVLMANEFHGREFPCTAFMPPYQPPVGDSWICTTVGSVAGEAFVNGDAYIAGTYRYYWAHAWRNVGILFGFLVFYMCTHFLAAEFNLAGKSGADVLVFPRGRVPSHLLRFLKKNRRGVEQPPPLEAEPSGENPGEIVAAAIKPQVDIFTWRDLVYEVPVKGGNRRLLSNVSGWVKPGSLTAVMGARGAGKTTLLNLLAQRMTTGVITGDMLVNGKPLPPAFGRNSGYIQQKDLHLDTATVRESLRFSAMLRQPNTVSKAEKYAYVEKIIDILNMRDFADAVVGVPGQGLNVEQSKLLTIGIELAAKPKLLLFLDEPTSGLDSQSAWAICTFLRRLSDAGQAILCTIHQPSGVLFQQFDRVLLLAEGGKTAYFGDIGENSRTLLDYFECNGARRCGDEENPAEYMLEVVKDGVNQSGQDWPTVWDSSEERSAVMLEVERIHEEKFSQPTAADTSDSNWSTEFAMPFTSQLRIVTSRVFVTYWRKPQYIFSKYLIVTLAGLFIGFSFYDADPTFAGIQNVLFSAFIIVTLFPTITQQIQPHFVAQRTLYEVRDRPSKAYSWQAFLIANMLVELPYQIVSAVLLYATFTYPVSGIQSTLKQGTVLLFCLQLFIYILSFAHMTIAVLPEIPPLVPIFTYFMITYAGIIQPANAMPSFWIFMYRASPFTYYAAGTIATQLHGRPIECNRGETNIFDPPANSTCGEYLAPFLEMAPSVLQNPDATAECQVCPLAVADQFLAGSRIFWSERWRNYGILWAFTGFNILVAIASFYLFKVRGWNKKPTKKSA